MLLRKFLENVKSAIKKIIICFKKKFTFALKVSELSQKMLKFVKKKFSIAFVVCIKVFDMHTYVNVNNFSFD